MKFIKMLKFDIKEGIIKNYFLFICPLLIAIPATVNTIYRLENYVKLDGNKDVVYSFGDIWMTLYGGMEKYVPSPDNPFNFPVIWSVIILIGSFLVLNYPVKDMLGVGTQYVVRGGSRKKWWFSKIIWNILSTIIYHGIIVGVMLLGCILRGIQINLNINVKLIEFLFEFRQPVDLYYVGSVPLSVIILPTITMITVNVVQMMLCLFFNPIYSFLMNSAFVISASFVMNRIFIYNYAMPLRYKWIFTEGFVHINGFYIMSIIFIFTIIAGMIRFLKYDIINKENT